MVELIWAGVIFIAIGFLFPIAVYMVRNFLKYGYKKMYFNLERALKWSWLVGLLLFLIGLMFIIIGATIPPVS